MILFSFADLENRKVLARNLKPDFHIHFVFTYKGRLRPKSDEFFPRRSFADLEKIRKILARNLNPDFHIFCFYL